MLCFCLHALCRPITSFAEITNLTAATFVTELKVLVMKSFENEFSLLTLTDDMVAFRTNLSSKVKNYKFVSRLQAIFENSLYVTFF